METPRLPPLPPDLTEELLTRERDWIDLRESGTTVVPTADLELLWADRARWRAWAMAAEAASRAPSGAGD